MSKTKLRTDLINAAMGAKRLTNEQVGDLAGVSDMTVSAIRNGKNTTLHSLEKVAEVLELSMEVLFSETAETETVITQ